MTEQDFKKYLKDEADFNSADISFKRNRRALALFVLLVVIGGIIIVTYFATGRGWSVAATMLDDNVGNMNSYTVVVFNGTGERPIEDKEESALITHVPIQKDLSEGLLPLDSNGEISYNNLSERVMSVFYRAMAKLKSENQDRVFCSDVRNLYETAGASACSLNISDLAYYETPQIYRAGDKKIGIFSVSSYAPRTTLSKITSKLRNEGADVVICITPKSSMVSTFNDIDVLISNAAPDKSNDQNKGDVVKIDAPYFGEVGIVLITANNVAVYKSISEL